MPVKSELYYHLYQGSGYETLPVVLIHGAGGTHLSWPPEVRRLAGVRVYAIDLPGHGKSPGRGQQSIAGYARSVLR
jgi:pimeloyl-ACP methyl ester carboxylesterase